MKLATMCSQKNIQFARHGIQKYFLNSAWIHICLEFLKNPPNIIFARRKWNNSIICKNTYIETRINPIIFTNSHFFMCKEEKSLKKIIEAHLYVAHPVLYTYIHETFSGTTNLARCALVGSAEEAVADNAIHGVPWKSRRWKERLESEDGWELWKTREGEESRAVVVVAIRWRRAKKWLIVTLSAICVLLPLQMTDPYRFCHGDIGATIAWKIAREIVKRGKKKKRRKFLPWRGGKMCRFFAFDRSESSIRLDSSLVILYFEQLT